MKFSIIVPFYNGLNYVSRLFETLEDYLNKQDCEVIIVDDCSNEEDFKFLENYINKRNVDNVHLIRNEKNGGAAYSRQKGVEIAKGEFIAFLDSDDGWVKDRIYILYDYMRLNSVDFIGGVNIQIGENDFLSERISQKVLFSDTCLTFTNFLFKNYFSTSSVMINKELFIRNGFNTDMRFSEDFECWRRILVNANAFYLTNSGNFSFKHVYLSKQANSLSSNTLKMSKGEINGLFKLFKNSELKLYQKFMVPPAIIYSTLKAMMREVRAKL